MNPTPEVEALAQILLDKFESWPSLARYVLDRESALRSRVKELEVSVGARDKMMDSMTAKIVDLKSQLAEMRETMVWIMNHAELEINRANYSEDGVFKMEDHLAEIYYNAKEALSPRAGEERE
jgi:phage shock protein A